MDKIAVNINENGLKTLVATDELDGKMYAHYEQDLTQHVEYATQLRNDDAYTKAGIKNGWMHAAHIPDVAIIELRKIGIDVFRAPAREIVAGLKKLGKDYLLTTRARV